MKPPDPLPSTFADAFKLRPEESLAFAGLIGFYRLTGLWRYPVEASGDLERMGFLDKVYWLHKARNPVRHAWRGSGLEEFFERQKTVRWTPPAGFTPQRTLTLSAAGDLMSHRYLARSGDSLYHDVLDDLFGADIAMANLECVIMPGAHGELEITTRSGPRLYLQRADFDVVKGTGGQRYGFLSTACNHSLDFGGEGVDCTIRALREEGIQQHGMNATEQESGLATVVESRGIRVGVVSFTFGLNARRPPADRPWIVNRMDLNGRPEEADLSLLSRQLLSCRKAGVDFVVAQLHWGMEHEFFPRPEQVAMAHHLAEMGVDAIIGHHPHVVQPLELYRPARDPARMVPVYYSLGNLTNPCSATFLCRSCVARIELTKGTAADGSSRTYASDAGAADIVQEVDHDRLRLAIEQRTST